MIKKVNQYILKYDLLPQYQAKVIVGFSGGVDSSVLLYILYCLGYECKVAHCNFHLRGEESFRDENQAASVAASMNMVFLKKDFNTQSIAKQRNVSVEMAARELRYEWFEQLRKEQNAEAIAVAHHREDNVETVLLNLLRGTGIRGLTGIKPKNGVVIRPLLGVTKQEILQFAKDNQIVYITDSSNLEDEFLRNKIRLKLLPLLQTLNPSVEQVLCRTIENLKEVVKIYDAYIEKVIKKIFDPSSGIINITELQKEPSPESILFELLKVYGFNREVICDIAHAMESLSGKKFYSPQYFLIKDRKHFLLVPRKEESKNEVYKIEENEKEITVPLKMRIHYEDIDDNFQIVRNSHVACFDVKNLRFPLQLRKWKKGDRFIPFGMQNFQKLSDYFNNHKFSRLKKDNTWLLCCGNNILWIVGERIDNRYKIDKATEKAIIFHIF